MAHTPLKWSSASRVVFSAITATSALLAMRGPHLQRQLQHNPTVVFISGSVLLSKILQEVSSHNFLAQDRSWGRNRAISPPMPPAKISNHTIGVLLLSSGRSIVWLKVMGSARCINDENHFLRVEKAHHQRLPSLLVLTV